MCRRIIATKREGVAADRGKNGHADRFWALALALEAGKTSGDSGPFYVFRNTPFSRHAISVRRTERLNREVLA